MAASPAIASRHFIARHTAAAAMWMAISCCVACGRSPASPSVQSQPKVNRSEFVEGARSSTPKSAALPAPVATPARYATRTFSAMGATVSVSLPASATMASQLRLVQGVFEVVQRRLSVSNGRSQVAAINLGAGVTAVTASADTRWLLKEALQLSRRTGRAWVPFNERARTDTELSSNGSGGASSALQPVDDLGRADHLFMDPAGGTVMLRSKDMRLDLADVLPGYALELAAEKLRMVGVSSFALRLGRWNIVSGGKRGEPWVVELPAWASPTNVAVSAKLRLFEGAVVTATVVDGLGACATKPTKPVVDPRTGKRPRALVSATVLASDPTFAGALARALLVLGPRRGLSLLDQMPAFDAIVIAADGRAEATAGVGDRWQVSAGLHARSPARLPRSSK